MCWQKSADNATKNVTDFVKGSDFFQINLVKNQSWWRETDAISWFDSENIP